MFISQKKAVVVKFKATIEIMPRQEILDPQGKATLLGLKNLGFDHFDRVRVGKRIELEIEAENQQGAEASAEEACKKLLANTVIEQFEWAVKPI